MTIKGVIKKIGETQSFGTNDFTKRDLIIQTAEEYPQIFCVEFIKDKTTLLDSFLEGQEVTVSINLRGKEWLNPNTNKTQYFTTINGWKIE
jgi:hypothetical protein